VVINFIKRIFQRDVDSAVVSVKQLRKIAELRFGEFTLKLATDADSDVVCRQLLRVVPGKRIVAEAIWQNKVVIAKVFYQRGQAKRHFMREQSQSAQLSFRGVLCPKILYAGNTQDPRVKIIIYEKVLGVALETLWKNKTTIASVRLLLQAMSIELATQHVLGVLQRDLHFKNFFVNKQKIITIDAGQVSFFDKPLSKKVSLKHLSLYFSQLGIGRFKLLKLLYETYAHARGWQIKEKDFRMIKRFVKFYQENRWERLQKKLLRTSSQFYVTKSFTQFVSFDKDYATPALQFCLLDPQQTASLGVTLKNGNSSTVSLVDIDNKKVVIKRYKIKGFWHGLRRCLRPTRAFTTWFLSHYLSMLDVAIPRPIAIVEKRFGFLKRESFLLMDYIPGEHAKDFFQHASGPQAQSVADKILFLLKKLSLLKLVHGDFKQTNVIIYQDNPYLIDLDGMVKKALFKKHQHIDYNRFMMNWRDTPEIAMLFK